MKGKIYTTAVTNDDDNDNGFIWTMIHITTPDAWEVIALNWIYGDLYRHILWEILTLKVKTLS